MSDDKRKLNKHSTGTVPKVKYTVKYRNNTGQQQFYSERDNLRNLPNNLVRWEFIHSYLGILLFTVISIIREYDTDFSNSKKKNSKIHSIIEQNFLFRVLIGNQGKNPVFHVTPNTHLMN